MYRIPTLRLFLVLLFLCCGLCFAEEVASTPNNWSRFRGPNGTGQGHGFELATDWDGKTFKWKITLPGEGHSSPVLWGDLLFVSVADAKTAQQTLLCYDALSGDKKWAKKLDAVPVLDAPSKQLRLQLAGRRFKACLFCLGG